MKKPDQAIVIRAALILFFIMAAPFAVELLILANITGMEVAALIALAGLRTELLRVHAQWTRFVNDALLTLHALSASHLFRPRNVMFHAGASSLVIVAVGSTALACVLWLPVTILSAGAMPGCGF